MAGKSGGNYNDNDINDSNNSSNRQKSNAYEHRNLVCYYKETKLSYHKSIGIVPLK